MLVLFVIRVIGILLFYLSFSYFVEGVPAITEIPEWIYFPYLTVAIIPALYFSSNNYLAKIRPDLMETRQMRRLYSQENNSFYNLTFFLGEYLMALVNTYYLIFFVLLIVLGKFIF